MDADELKARAALLAALVGSGLLGYFWLSAIPSTVAEIKANAALVRQGGMPEWQNPFMARARGKSDPRPAPPPLPAVGGELPYGCAGALLAVGVTLGVFALWRRPWLCLVALPGFFFGPLAGEGVVRALTNYPAGDVPGLWCGLGVAAGLVVGPALLAGVVAEFRRGLETIAGT